MEKTAHTVKIFIATFGDRSLFSVSQRHWQQVHMMASLVSPWWLSLDTLEKLQRKAKNQAIKVSAPRPPVGNRSEILPYSCLAYIFTRRLIVSFCYSFHWTSTRTPKDAPLAFAGSESARIFTNTLVITSAKRFQHSHAAESRSASWDPRRAWSQVRRDRYGALPRQALLPCDGRRAHGVARSQSRLYLGTSSAIVEALGDAPALEGGKERR